jgi:hypothetical protein
VTFENGSRLEQIEKSAFAWTGLKSIEIPSSVVALGEQSFYGCDSLKSVTFESGSQLERIDELMFDSCVSFSSVSQEFTEARKSGRPVIVY